MLQLRLFQPSITEYKLADGSYRTPAGERVTRYTPGAVKTERQSKKWYGSYAGANGEPVRVPLSENKETAKRMLRRLVAEAETASVGGGDPTAKHRGKKLADHLEEYRSYLEAKGDSPAHVKKTVARCHSVIGGIDAGDLGDVQPSAVVEFLAGLRGGGPERTPLPDGKAWFTKAELIVLLGVNPASVARMMLRANLTGQGNGKARRYPRAAVELLQDRCCRGAGITTSNHYLTAMKGFTRWLARNGRALSDPLAYLARMNPDVDVRLERRALSRDEFTTLVEETRGGRPFRGLTGAARALLYLTAANTGLRASELASLTRASFNLAERSVTVQAAYSKRRRKDVLLLRADLAETLAAELADKAKASKVWPGTWAECGAEMIRRDLAAAGIPFIDHEGRVYDFHSLRHQFISDLVAAGVHPKVAQSLARHSTITLTMDRYTHVSLSDQAAALEKLPGVSPTKKKSASRHATA